MPLRLLFFRSAMFILLRMNEVLLNEKVRTKSHSENNFPPQIWLQVSEGRVRTFPQF